MPATAAIPMPDGVSPEVAALIGCGLSTGVGAVLKTADVPAGSTVAVIGLGGVGLSCVMGAVLAAAGRIVAVDTNPAKLTLAASWARRTGPGRPGRSGRDLERIRDAAGAGGPDFVFEAIGLPATIEQAIPALPRGGTAVLVGMTPFGEARRSRGSRSSTARAGSSARTTGRRSRPIDFPRYAEWFLAGRLPIDRLSTAASRSTTSTTPSTGCGPGRRRARSSCSRMPRPLRRVSRPAARQER